MKKYLLIAYSIVLSAYCLFLFLGSMYKSFYIPGISDAPFYVFLAFAAPFLIIGLFSKFLNIKTYEPREDIPVGAANIEVIKTSEASTDPSYEGIKYTKNDWIFTVLSVLKVPLILAALFGGLFAVIMGIGYFLRYLNSH